MTYSVQIVKKKSGEGRKGGKRGQGGKGDVMLQNVHNPLVYFVYFVDWVKKSEKVSPDHSDGDLFLRQEIVQTPKSMKAIYHVPAATLLTRLRTYPLLCILACNLIV